MINKDIIVKDLTAIYKTLDVNVATRIHLKYDNANNVYFITKATNYRHHYGLCSFINTLFYLNKINYYTKWYFDSKLKESFGRNATSTYFWDKTEDGFQLRRKFIKRLIDELESYE